ncbi:MAG: hypothetical protein HON47_01035 [Candidatus Diapherotrites archaeon]|jgi:hypothetical protein|uniref:KaiC-like domain-containing protein n=1 Tax=Candidatus Iainarchaeum sp. TaxID=3101447 RepID=A0A8T5GE86_9ARCH|nr:hypothetical protein [Candidatus Diapherotrites archaeon]
MGANYLKELFSDMSGKNSLSILNQKQFQDSIDYSLEKILTEKPLIFISMTRSAEDILTQVGEKKENLFIIDVFSKETTFANGIEPNIIYISNPANLTSIQIAVDKALKKFPSATILFDSLGVLSVYSEEKLFQKFIYLFNNKMNLLEGTVLFFAIKNTIEEEILSTVKQFCDKTYDFSELYIASVELAH